MGRVRPVTADCVCADHFLLFISASPRAQRGSVPGLPARSDARQPALTERVRERSHIPAHREREREAEGSRGRGRGGVGGGETESGARSTPRR